MERIEARMIIEIMGRPVEHVVDALNQLIDKLGKEQGVTLRERKVREPVAVKEAKDLFTTFAEIDVEFDSVITCFRIVFTYLPAHIEISAPEHLKLKNDDISTIANAIAARMHDYDAIAKRLVSEREILVNRLKESQKNVDKPAKKES